MSTSIRIRSSRDFNSRPRVEGVRTQSRFPAWFRNFNSRPRVEGVRPVWCAKHGIPISILALAWRASGDYVSG